MLVRLLLATPRGDVLALARAPEGTAAAALWPDLVRACRDGAGPPGAEAGEEASAATPGGRGDDVDDPALGRAGHRPGGHVPLTIQGHPLDPCSRLGSPPLVDGARIGLADAADPGAGPGRSPGPRADTGLELVVTGGPGAGRRRALSPGVHVLGRSGDADLVVAADPGLSRRHVRLEVDGRGRVHVADAGSRNGTRIGGRPLRGRTRLRPGVDLSCGATTLQVRARPNPRPRGTARGDGTVALNRRPRGQAPLPPPLRRLDAVPQEGEAPALDALTVLLPVTVSLVVAGVTGSAIFLLFGLLSPALALAQTIGERRRRRRRHAQALAEHAADRAHAADRLAADTTRERRRREADCPDPARVADIAAARLDDLWDRRHDDPDLLRVRLGRGRVRALAGLDESGRGVRHPWLDDAPVTLRLDRGPVGVHGPRDATLALARCLVGQVVTRASPRDVRVWVLAASTSHLADWSWVALLPHAHGDDAELARCAAWFPRAAGVSTLAGRVAASARSAGTATSPAHVVVVDGAHDLRAVPGIADLLDGLPGVHLLCLDEARSRLPVECASLVDLTADAALPDPTPADRAADPDVGPTLTGPAAVDVHRGPVRVDGVDEDWCVGLARALAPLRDVTARLDDGPGALPVAVDLADLLAATDPERVAETWGERPRDTRAVVGVGAHGPHAVDLLTDGPHVLVGGMTGSGKSELLRALLVSLAYVNRPDELAFVLLDYKGGSAFDGCAGLPHTVGVVTDLDAESTHRALISLRAELRRREETLRRAGATTIEEYQGLRDAAERAPIGRPDGPAPGPLPAMPRLVVVVDEFRALAEELPDVVSGLVRVATQGRSLGLHLVLATQRPAGVVSAEIKANTNLRIALRVRDRADSQDVIDADDAARLPTDRPGRALLRTGGGALVSVQVARTGGTAPRGATRPALRLLGMHDLAEPTADVTTPVTRVRSGGSAASRPTSGLDRPEGPEGPEGHGAVLRAAAARCTVDPVAAPWLPPLPTRLSIADLPAQPPSEGTLRDTIAGEESTAYREGPADALLPFALADLPDRQCRATVGVGLRAGDHVAVVGGPGSGRSSTLATLVEAAGEHCPDALHVHVLDGAHALAPVAGDAMCATYVGVDEPGRMRRLLARLAGVVRERSRTTASRPGEHGGQGGPDTTLCPACGGRTGGRPAAGTPALLVLVDDVDRVREAVERVDPAAVEDLLLVLRRGSACGVRVVATGGRSLLFGTLGGLFGDRFLLRVTDPADVLLAGLPAAAAPPAIPGRARRLSDGALVQIARVDAGGRTTPPGRPRPRRGRPSCRPVSAWRHDALPAAVALADLPEPAGRPDSGGGLPFGLAADTLSGVGLPPGEYLAAGPPGSGRTTLLRTLAAGARRRGAAVTVVGADPGAGWPEGTRVEGSGEIPAPPPAGVHLVLVDDLERLADTPVEDALLRLLAVHRPDRTIVAAGDSTRVAASFRGLAPALRRSARGILLCPGPADRDVLGLAPPVGEAPFPGRGALCDRGVWTVLQVALPPDP
ncbi:FtsK/SpoIIIE domain-containing protein [Agilicoccus flavus]|uniref:FtsK/SpoIIIE domain-containing protein n=1 Tax=Agilicoccus flavus TaxID=2775968 RepID=UPI001CF635F7|nr:FtsK/SpoIIIE domain-containing protein [Agilicoccus flavus]